MAAQAPDTRYNRSQGAGRRCVKLVSLRSVCNAVPLAAVRGNSCSGKVRKLLLRRHKHLTTGHKGRVGGVLRCAAQYIS